MGVCVPEEHGGAGADFLSYVLVIEEISRGDAGVGVTLAVHTSACTLPMIAHGSEEQVERASCRRSPRATSSAAFALTEAGSGSDAGAMLTRGRRDDRDHRHEAVDHQRLARATRSWSSRAIADKPSLLRRPPRRRRLHGDARGGEDGPELLLDGRPGLRRHAGRAARRARRRDAHRSVDAGRRAHRDRGAGGRASRRPRWTSRSATRRSATRSAADRRPPGDPAEARRHADRGRGGPRAALARGAR